MERRAVEAEELSRIEAKHDRRVSRSPQGVFKLYSPSPLKKLRQSELQNAENWLHRQLNRFQILSYKEALSYVLERFSVTETELKDLLISMQKRGLVGFEGMRPRQRKPDDGVIISLRLR